MYSVRYGLRHEERSSEGADELSDELSKELRGKLRGCDDGWGSVRLQPRQTLSADLHSPDSSSSVTWFRPKLSRRADSSRESIGWNELT